MPLKSRRILVVEDDPAIREIVSEMLQMEGHSVAVASDGAEGLKRAREFRPEVILLDLMMPVMDGWQFLAAREREEELARIPVVVVSATLPADLATTPHLPKPFEPLDLFATVERVAA